MRASLGLVLAFAAGCSVPDFFLVDAGGGGTDDSGRMDGGPDAPEADAAVDAPPGAATVTGVTSTNTDGYYKAGTSISIQVTFSQAVTVDTTGGTPTLALNTGVNANYASGTGTTSLTFTYTVAAGNAVADLDYMTASALSANGGTIKNGTNNAFLTLPAPGAAGSLGANKALVIDAVAPTISTVTGPNTYMASASATLAFTVTETNLGTTTCTQTVGSGVMSSCTATGAMFTSLNDGPHTISITHTDAAGNISTAQTYSWTVDTVAPVLSTITGPAQYVQTATAALSYSTTETNQGTTTCTQTVGSGTMGTCSASGVTFTGLSEGPHTVTVVHTDLAGTPSATRTYSWTVDLTNPNVSTITGPAAYEPSASASLAYTVTETNQGTTACSFTVGLGTISTCNATGAMVAGLNEGPHTLQVTHTDLSGRTGSRTYSWTVDTILPAFTNVVGPTNGWTATSSASITYTLNDANLGTTTTCLQIDGTGTQMQCDNTRAVFTGLSIGKHTIEISHTDLAGNVGGTIVQFSYCPPAVFTAADISNFTVPADCGTQMDIQVWGAGGGGGRTNGAIGGGGGYASGTLVVAMGQDFIVRVGGGGSPSNNGAGGGGFNDGGNAGLNGGGGGGWSGVQGPSGEILRVAGGGGGGACSGNGSGGAGGGLSGQSGGNGGGGIQGGFGATQAGPGAGGTPGGRSGYNFGLGGEGSDSAIGCAGGGGGGGRFGGGGGGAPSTGAGGGGGGGGGCTTIFSSLTSPVNQIGSGPTSGGASAPNYINGRGQGGSQGAAGGNGMVILHVHP